VIAVRFISRLIENEKIARHLELHHPEVFTEFGVIVQAVSLDQSFNSGARLSTALTMAGR
jgi:hypothetical protein